MDGADATNLTACSVVMCSSTTLRSGTRSSSGFSTVSMKTASLSNMSTFGSVTSPCTSSRSPACKVSHELESCALCGQYRVLAQIAVSPQSQERLSPCQACPLFGSVTSPCTSSRSTACKVSQKLESCALCGQYRLLAYTAVSPQSKKRLSPCQECPLLGSVAFPCTRSRCPVCISHGSRI